jgi:hypothetical protein
MTTGGAWQQRSQAPPIRSNPAPALPTINERKTREMKMHTEIAWERPDDITEEQLEALGAGLPGFPTVIDSGLLIYLRTEIDEIVEHTVDAVDVAADIAARASRRAWGALVDPVQISVYPAERGLIPGPLDIVGMADIAQDLGVTRQAVAQRTDQLPAPLGTSSNGPVWVRAAARAITSTWSSRPGRRSRPAEGTG